jgi:hypothetical protein
VFIIKEDLVMKNIFANTISSLILVLIFQSSFAKTTKQDTSYYLVDTLNTPFQDRMISVKQENNNQFFTIECPCLQDNNKPVFRSNITKAVQLDDTKFKALKLARLTELISLVKKNDKRNFNKTYIVYFIRKDGPTYYKNRAYFLGGQVTTTY